MAHAPKERPGDEALQLLTPRQQLERIQELLTAYSSDAVRKFLFDHNYDVDGLMARDPSMAS
jgi:hypothetical protein